MSRKFSEARRAAFIRAVAATGNQTIAAERAKVSRSWVTLHRSTDPAFDAAVRAAIEEARARFDGLGASGEGSRKPPAGWGSLDGEELVVKGTGGPSLGPARDEPFDCALRLRSGQAQDRRQFGRRVQIARARLKQWTPRAEARFLATLAATCNVKAACAEVGLTAASAYAHRKRWPRFASLWDQALETGYARIEIALVETGCNLFSPAEVPPEVAISGMTAEQALHVLHMHKQRVHGIGGTPGRAPLPPTMNDPAIRASIKRKIAAIRAARGIAPEVRAADAEAYAARRWGAEGDRE